jgi:Rps23 Pro-64 3,4-dihydroxylase Tpa1-like proline 4-hydroxylase
MNMVALNPDMDVASLSRAFARDGRVQIRNFLAGPEADALAGSLADLDWRLVFNTSDRHIDLPRPQIEQAGPDRMSAIIEEVGKRATNGFQYLYQNYPVTDLEAAGQLTHRELDAAYRTMNSSPALDLLRAITGLACDFCDMQATRYSAGHFLTVHDDLEPRKKRTFAYVLGLSKNWSPTWGGQLQFLDSKHGSVIDSYVPAFNSLSLLRVPQPHHVSQVASFAPSGRVSLTGWYRLRS